MVSHIGLRASATGECAASETFFRRIDWPAGAR